ncbi:hypothetical protein IAT40_006548 [Kwoniella sp. CBS 6097]
MRYSIELEKAFEAARSKRASSTEDRHTDPSVQSHPAPQGRYAVCFSSVRECFEVYRAHVETLLDGFPALEEVDEVDEVDEVEQAIEPSAEVKALIEAIEFCCR